MPLGLLPELIGLTDADLNQTETPRIIIGSVLIPCIFIEDVLPVDQRIQQPYTMYSNTDNPDIEYDRM